MQPESPPQWTGSGQMRTAYGVARGGQVDAQAVVRDVDVGPDLLGPVARHPAADGEDAEPLRPEGEPGEAVQVEEGVVARQVVEEAQRGP